MIGKTGESEGGREGKKGEKEGVKKNRENVVGIKRIGREMSPRDSKNSEREK